MIGLKHGSRNISSRAQKYLAKCQTSIDGLTLYSDQVKQAEKKWNTVKKSNLTFLEIKQELSDMCPGFLHCHYCEDAHADDIEHFRPKALYPEETFRWENYLYACNTCNSRVKMEQFSVFDSSGMPQDVSRPDGVAVLPPIDGDNVLLNPRFENPLDFIELSIPDTFFFAPLPDLSTKDTARAECTIKMLKLNARSELSVWRKGAYTAYRGWLKEYIEFRDNQPDRVANHMDIFYDCRQPCVWYEMKRKHTLIQELHDLFSKAPETLAL